MYDILLLLIKKNFTFIFIELHASHIHNSKVMNLVVGTIDKYHIGHPKQCIHPY